jgi:hypothetical protein
MTSGLHCCLGINPAWCATTTATMLKYKSSLPYFGIITTRRLLLTSGLSCCLGIITVQCATTTATMLEYIKAVCLILELLLPAAYY